MQVCEPSAGSMLICVSVVVVPWVFGLTPALPTIDHAYESPFCGSGFAQVNCTLPPSAEYDPVRFSTLGTLPVVMAESGESFSGSYVSGFLICTLLLSETESIFGMITYANTSSTAAIAATTETTIVRGLAQMLRCFGAVGET